MRLYEAELDKLFILSVLCAFVAIGTRHATSLHGREGDKQAGLCRKWHSPGMYYSIIDYSAGSSIIIGLSLLRSTVTM